MIRLDASNVARIKGRQGIPDRRRFLLADGGFLMLRAKYWQGGLIIEVPRDDFEIFYPFPPSSCRQQLERLMTGLAPNYSECYSLHRNPVSSRTAP